MYPPYTLRLGLASVFSNIDLGNEVVVAGAFARTLKARGNEVPILWQHNAREPVGIGKLAETGSGLMVEGQLILWVSKAREAYDPMKARILKGLSIGYVVIRDEVKSGVRYLQELKLYEVSLVTFPMNEMATVTSVKQGNNLDAQLVAVAEELRAAREMWRR